MSELAELRQDVRDLHIFVLRILGTRLSKAELAKELSISPRTLDKRVSLGIIRKPLFRKWLAADLMEHRDKWMEQPPRIATPVEIPDVEPQPIPFGQDGHHLYRHFDCEGNLLYVGVSQSALHRLKKHRHLSPWFSHIARVEMTVYKTREDVLIAERLAIQREKPRHNIQHSLLERATA